MARDTHPEFRLTSNGKEISESQLREDFPDVFSFLEEWNKKSAVVELQTSGSTGVPKRFEVAKDVMWHSAGATIAALNLSTGLRALNPLSCAYVAGKMMVVRAMRGGWRLELTPPSTGVLSDLMDNFDFAAFVPMQVRGAAHNLNKIGCTILGGAPVDTDLEAELSGVKTKVYETFGMTETVSHIAIRQVAPRGNTHFEALPTVEFSKSNEGTLTIHAPAWGYEELKTNDVVELLGNENFKWLGRADFVINSGGIKLHPEVIEPKLRSVLHAEVYVTSESHKELGEQMIGVVLKGTVLPNDSKFLKRGLSKYEIPKAWKEVDEFPMTASGKISRKEL